MFGHLNQQVIGPFSSFRMLKDGARLAMLSISFSTFLFCSEEKTLQESFLKAPRFKQEDVLCYKAGLRPFRKSGIRLEPEYWKEKLIIHDYGHGGSGISLSWGSACLAVALLDAELDEGFQPGEKHAAVIGSGVIGLTTAHLLADKGWSVHVYASHFPPYTTSDIAPGFWNKVLIASSPSLKLKLQLPKILYLSFHYFNNLANNSKSEFQGVSPIEVYTFKPDPPISSSLKGLIPPGIPIAAFFNHQEKKEGQLFQSFLADTSVYMPSLFEKAKDKGVLFSQKTFHSKEDLSSLEQKVLFNCTGLGSKELFNDPELIGVNGQLIELKREEGVNSILAGPTKDGVDLYLIPLRDKIILGGTYEFGSTKHEVNVVLAEQILNHAREFFQGHAEQQ